jgi:hypothetical protein
MDLFFALGWALFYLASLFAIWQLASQAVERKTFHRMEGLRRRNDTLQSTVCTLQGEVGVLRNQLQRARDDAMRSARKASEFAASLLKPRVDELVILGGEDRFPEFAPTERMCHV